MYFSFNRLDVLITERSSKYILITNSFMINALITLSLVLLLVWTLRASTTEITKGVFNLWVSQKTQKSVTKGLR